MKLNQILLLITLVVAFAACKKNVDDPNDETDHEAINAVTLTFKENGVVAGVFRMEDPDGDGGNPPTRIDVITLESDKIYTMEITLENITSTGTRDVTDKIRSEGKNHEFYFLPSGVNVSITKTDKDVNNNPIGLNSTWETSVQATGTVLLKLMHKPFIKGPNDAHTVGHSDLSVNLSLVIN